MPFEILDWNLIKNKVISTESWDDNSGTSYQRIAYDVKNKGNAAGIKPPKPIDQMTIGELTDWQNSGMRPLSKSYGKSRFDASDPRAIYGSTGVGKYQIERSTLIGAAKKKYGKNYRDVVFDANAQDELAGQIYYDAAAISEEMLYKQWVGIKPIYDKYKETGSLDFLNTELDAKVINNNNQNPVIDPSKSITNINIDFNINDPFKDLDLSLNKIKSAVALNERDSKTMQSIAINNQQNDAINHNNQVNSYNALESRQKIDVVSLINNPKFMPGATVFNKLGTVADIALGKTYKTVDYYAQLRGTSDYAESIAANQNYFIDSDGSLVNEAPSSKDLFKLTEYGGDWALQRVPMNQDTDGQHVFSLNSLPSVSSTYIGSAVRGALNSWVYSMPSSTGALLRVADDLVDYIAYGEDRNGGLENIANILSNTSKGLIRQNKDEMSGFGNANSFIYGVTSGLGSVMTAMTGSNLGGSMGSVFGTMLKQNPIKTSLAMSRIGGLGLNSLAVASSFREFGKSRGIDDMTITMMSLPMMAATIWSESKFGPNVFLDYYTNTNTRAALNGIFNNAASKLRQTAAGTSVASVKEASKTLVEQLADFAKMKSGTSLHSFTIGALEEGTEEVFESLIQNSLQVGHDMLKSYNKMLPSDSQATFGTKSIFEGAGESFVYGAIAGGMVGGVFNTKNVRQSQLIQAVMDNRENELHNERELAYTTGLMGGLNIDINGNEITYDQDGKPSGVSVADQLNGIFKSEIDNLVRIRDQYGLDGASNISTDLAEEFISNQLKIDEISKLPNKTDNDTANIGLLQERNRKIINGVVNEANTFNALNSMVLNYASDEYIKGDELGDDFKVSFSKWVSDIVDNLSGQFEFSQTESGQTAIDYLSSLNEFLKTDLTKENMGNISLLLNKLSEVSGGFNKALSSMGVLDENAAMLTEITSKASELQLKLQQLYQDADIQQRSNLKSQAIQAGNDTDEFGDFYSIDEINELFDESKKSVSGFAKYKSVNQQRESYIKSKLREIVEGDGIKKFFTDFLFKDINTITSGDQVREFVKSVYTRSFADAIAQLESKVEEDQITEADAKNILDGYKIIAQQIKNRMRYIRSLQLVAENSSKLDNDLLFDIYQEVERINLNDQLKQERLNAGEEHIDSDESIKDANTVNGIYALTSGELSQDVAADIESTLTELDDRMAKLADKISAKISDKAIIERQFAIDDILIKAYSLSELLRIDAINNNIPSNLKDRIDALKSKIDKVKRDADKNKSLLNSMFDNKESIDMFKEVMLIQQEIHDHLSKKGNLDSVIKQALDELGYNPNVFNTANLFNSTNVGAEKFIALLANDYRNDNGDYIEKHFTRNTISNIVLSIYRGTDINAYSSIIDEMQNELKKQNDKRVITHEQEMTLLHMLGFVFQSKVLNFKNSSIGRMLYVTGVGGAGKTTLVNILTKFIKNKYRTSPNEIKDVTIISVTPNKELGKNSSADHSFTISEFFNQVNSKNRPDFFNNNNVIIIFDEAHVATKDQLSTIDSYLKEVESSGRIGKIIYLGDPQNQNTLDQQLNSAIYNEQTNQLRQVHRSGNSSVWQFGSQISKSILDPSYETTYGKGLSYYSKDNTGVQSMASEREVIDAFKKDTDKTSVLIVYSEKEKNELIKNYGLDSIYHNRILLIEDTSNNDNNVKGLQYDRVYIIYKYTAATDDSVVSKRRLYVAVSRAKNYVGIHASQTDNIKITTSVDTNEIKFSEASDLGSNPDYIESKKKRYDVMSSVVTGNRNLGKDKLADALKQLYKEFRDIYKAILKKDDRIKNIAEFDKLLSSKKPGKFVFIKNNTKTPISVVKLGDTYHVSTKDANGNNEITTYNSSEFSNNYLSSNDELHFYSPYNDMSYLLDLGTPSFEFSAGIEFRHNSLNERHTLVSVVMYDGKKYYILSNENNDTFYKEESIFNNEYVPYNIANNDVDTSVDEDNPEYKNIGIKSSRIFHDNKVIPIIMTSMNSADNTTINNPEIAFRVKLFEVIGKSTSNFKLKLLPFITKTKNGDIFSVGYFIDINDDNSQEFRKLLSDNNMESLITNMGYQNIDDYISSITNIDIVNNSLHSGAFLGYSPMPEMYDGFSFGPMFGSVANMTKEAYYDLKNRFDDINEEFATNWVNNNGLDSLYKNAKVRYNQHLFDVFTSYMDSYFENNKTFAPASESSTRPSTTTTLNTLASSSGNNTKYDFNQDEITLLQYKNSVKSKFGNSSVIIGDNLQFGNTELYYMQNGVQQIGKKYSIFAEWNWSWSNQSKGKIHLYMPKITKEEWDNNMYDDLKIAYKAIKDFTLKTSPTKEEITQFANLIRDNEFFNFVVSNNSSILNLLKIKSSEFNNVSSLYDYVLPKNEIKASVVRDSIDEIYRILMDNKSTISNLIENNNLKNKLRHTIVNHGTDNFRFARKYLGNGFTIDQMVTFANLDNMNFPVGYSKTSLVSSIIPAETTDQKEENKFEFLLSSLQKITGSTSSDIDELISIGHEMINNGELNDIAVSEFEKNINDYDLGKTKILDDNANYTWISEIEAKQELMRLLGFDVVDQNVIADTDLKDHRGPLLGLVKSNKIFLRRKWNNGKAYMSYEAARHEAIHYILDYVLSKEARENIITLAKKAMKNMDATDIEAEEWLSNKFEHHVKYVKNKYKRKGQLNRFFTWALSVFDNIFKRSDEIEDFFEQVDRGQYAKNARAQSTVYASTENLTTSSNENDRHIVEQNRLSDVNKNNVIYWYFDNNIELANFAGTHLSEHILNNSGYKKTIINHNYSDFASAVKKTKNYFSNIYNSQLKLFRDSVINGEINTLSVDDRNAIIKFDTLQKGLYNNKSNPQYMEEYREAKRLANDIFLNYNRFSNTNNIVEIKDQENRYTDSFIARINIALGSPFMFKAMINSMYRIDSRMLDEELSKVNLQKPADNPVSKEGNETIDALSDRGVTRLINDIVKLSGSYSPPNSENLKKFGRNASAFGILQFFWSKEKNTTANESVARQSLLTLAMLAKANYSENQFMFGFSEIIKRRIEQLTSIDSVNDIGGVSGDITDADIDAYKAKFLNNELDHLFAVYNNVFRNSIIDTEAINAFLAITVSDKISNGKADKYMYINALNGLINNMSYFELANEGNINALSRAIANINELTNEEIYKYLTNISNLHKKSKDLIHSFSTTYRSTIRQSYTKVTATFSDNDVKFTTSVLSGYSKSEVKDAIRTRLMDKMYSGIGVARSLRDDAVTKYSDNVTVKMTGNNYSISIDDEVVAIYNPATKSFNLGYDKASKRGNISKISARLGLSKVLTDGSIHVALYSLSGIDITSKVLGYNTGENGEMLLAKSLITMLLTNKAIVMANSDNYKNDIGYKSAIDLLEKLVSSNDIEKYGNVGSYDLDANMDNTIIGNENVLSNQDSGTIKEEIEKGTMDATRLWRSINDLSGLINYTGNYLLTSTYYSVMGNRISTSIRSSHFNDIIGGNFGEEDNNNVLNSYIDDSDAAVINNPFYTGAKLRSSDNNITSAISKILLGSESAGQIQIMNASMFEGVQFYSQGLRQDIVNDADYIKAVFSNFVTKLLNRDTSSKSVSNDMFSTAIVPMHQPSDRKYIPLVKIGLRQPILVLSKQGNLDKISLNKNYIATHVLSIATDHFTRFNQSFDKLFNDNFIQFIYDNRNVYMPSFGDLDGIDFDENTVNDINKIKEIFYDIFTSTYTTRSKALANINKQLSPFNRMLNDYIIYTKNILAQENIMSAPNYDSVAAFEHDMYLRSINTFNFDSYQLGIKLLQQSDDGRITVSVGNIFFDTSKTIDSMFDQYATRYIWQKYINELIAAQTTEEKDAVVEKVMTKYLFDNNSASSLTSRSSILNNMLKKAGFSFSENLTNLINDSVIQSLNEDNLQDNKLVNETILLNEQDNLSINIKDNMVPARTYKANEKVLDSIKTPDINLKDKTITIKKLSQLFSTLNNVEKDFIVSGTPGKEFIFYKQIKDISALYDNDFSKKVSERFNQLKREKGALDKNDKNKEIATLSDLGLSNEQFDQLIAGLTQASYYYDYATKPDAKELSSLSVGYDLYSFLFDSIDAENGMFSYGYNSMSKEGEKLLSDKITKKLKNINDRALRSKIQSLLYKENGEMQISGFGERLFNEFVSKDNLGEFADLNSYQLGAKYKEELKRYKNVIEQNPLLRAFEFLYYLSDYYISKSTGFGVEGQTDSQSKYYKISDTAYSPGNVGDVGSKDGLGNTMNVAIISSFGKMVSNNSIPILHPMHNEANSADSTDGIHTVNVNLYEFLSNSYGELNTLLPGIGNMIKDFASDTNYANDISRILKMAGYIPNYTMVFNSRAETKRQYALNQIDGVRVVDQRTNLNLYNLVGNISYNNYFDLRKQAAEALYQQTEDKANQDDKVARITLDQAFVEVGKLIHEEIVRNNDFNKIIHLAIYPGAVKIGNANMQLDPEYAPAGYTLSPSFNINSRNYRIQLNTVQNTEDEYIKHASQIVSSINGTNDNVNSTKISNALSRIIDITLNKYKNELKTVDSTLTANERKGVVANFLRRISLNKIKNTNKATLFQSFLLDPNVNMDMPSVRNKVFEYLISDLNSKMAVRLRGIRANQQRNVMDIYRYGNMAITRNGIIKTFKFDPFLQPEKLSEFGIRVDKLNNYKYYDKSGKEVNTIENSGNITYAKASEVIMAHSNLSGFGLDDSISLAEIFLINVDGKFVNIKNATYGLEGTVNASEAIVNLLKSGAVNPNDLVATRALPQILNKRIKELSDLVKEEENNPYAAEEVAKYEAEIQRLSGIMNVQSNQSQEDLINEIGRWYEEFERSLYVTAVRVPATGTNSGHYAEIVELAPSDVSTIFITSEKNIIDGSDFDIDQLSVYFYSSNLYSINDVDDIKYDNQDSVLSLSNEVWSALINHYRYSITNPDGSNNISNIINYTQPLTTKYAEDAADIFEQSQRYEKTMPLHSFGNTMARRSVEYDGASIVGIAQNSLTAYNNLTRAIELNQTTGTYNSVYNQLKQLGLLQGIFNQLGVTVNLATDNKKINVYGRVNLSRDSSNSLSGAIVYGFGYKQSIYHAIDPNTNSTDQWSNLFNFFNQYAVRNVFEQIKDSKRIGNPNLYLASVIDEAIGKNYKKLKSIIAVELGYDTVITDDELQSYYDTIKAEVIRKKTTAGESQEYLDSSNGEYLVNNIEHLLALKQISTLGVQLFRLSMVTKGRSGISTDMFEFYEYVNDVNYYLSHDIDIMDYTYYSNAYENMRYKYFDQNRRTELIDNEREIRGHFDLYSIINSNNYFKSMVNMYGLGNYVLNNGFSINNRLFSSFTNYLKEQQKLDYIESNAMMVTLQKMIGQVYSFKYLEHLLNRDSIKHEDKFYHISTENILGGISGVKPTKKHYNLLDPVDQYEFMLYLSELIEPFKSAYINALKDTSAPITLNMDHVINKIKVEKSSNGVPFIKLDYSILTAEDSRALLYQSQWNDLVAKLPENSPFRAVAQNFKNYLFIYEMISNQFAISSNRVSSVFSKSDFAEYYRVMNNVDTELNDETSDLYKKIESNISLIFHDFYSYNKSVASRGSRYFEKGAGLTKEEKTLREGYTNDLLPVYMLGSQKRTDVGILAKLNVKNDTIEVSGSVGTYSLRSLWMSRYLGDNDPKTSSSLLINWELYRLNNVDKIQLPDNEIRNVYHNLDFEQLEQLRNGNSITVSVYNNQFWLPGLYLLPTGDRINVSRKYGTQSKIVIKIDNTNQSTSNGTTYASSRSNGNLLTNKQFNWVVKRIRKSFPNITVEKYYDINDDKYSYVQNGIVYLNQAKISGGTAMHELAHIFLPIIKATNPSLYNAIRVQALSSDIMRHINNSPAYKDHTLEDKEEEAMAYMFESLSEKKINRIIESDKRPSLLQTLRNAISSFINYIYADILGNDYMYKYIVNLDPSTVTVDEFISNLSDAILSGKTITNLNSDEIMEFRNNRLLYAKTINLSTVSDFKGALSYTVENNNISSIAASIYDLIDVNPENGYLTYVDSNGDVINLGIKAPSVSSVDSAEIDKAIIDKVLPRLGQRQMAVQTAIYDYLIGGRDRKANLKNSAVGNIFNDNDANIDTLNGIVDYDPAYDIVVNLSDKDSISLYSNNDVVNSILTPEYLKALGNYKPLIIIHNAKASKKNRDEYGVDVSFIDFSTKEEAAYSVNEKKSIIDKVEVSDYYKNKVKLRNTNNDHKKMALALLAMKLKQTNPEVSIRSAKIARMYSRSLSYEEVYMPDIIKDMKIIKQILVDYAKSNPIKVNDDIASIFDDETLFDPVIYDRNYIAKLISYVSMNTSGSSTTPKVTSVYSKIKDNLDNKDVLIYGVKERMKEIVSNEILGNPSVKDEDIYTNKEYIVLSGILYQLENRKFDDRNSMTDLSDIETLIRSSSRLNNDIAVFARDAIVIGEKTINNRYWNDYAKKTQPVLKKLKDNNIVRGLLTDASESLFKRLFIFIDVNDENGNKVKIPTGHIHYTLDNPHTKRAFDNKEISQDDLDQAKIIVEQVRKYAKQMFRNTLSTRYSGDELEARVNKRYEEDWQDGMLPYVYKDFLGQLFEFKFSESINTLSSQLNRKDVLFNQDVEKGDTFNIEDRFLNQAGKNYITIDNYKYNLGGTERSRMAGYSIGINNSAERYIQVKEKTKLDRISTNLEAMMNFFAYNAIRHDVITNDIMPKVNAAKSLLYSYNYSANFTANNNAAMKNNIQYINYMTDKIVKGMRYNIDEVVNLGPNVNISINALVETMRSVNTATGFMLNFGLFVRSMVQNITQTLGNTMADSTSKMFWTAEDVAFATKELFSSPKGSAGFQKIDKLMDHFQMMNMDSYALMNSARRKVADQFLFNSDTMYYLNYIPDYMVRATIMIAALHNSGSYDAYSIDSEGNLVYDEEKDNRWKKPNGDIIKNDVKREQIKQGLLESMDEKMKLSHDFYEADVWKNYSDNYIVGQMDQISQVNLNIYGLGKVFLQFQNYLIAKKENLYTKSYSDRSMSYRTVKDKNGKQEVIWHSNMMEGKLNTIIDTFSKVKNQYSMGLTDLNKLTPFQVRNLTKISADLGIYMSLFIIFALLKDSDDDRRLKSKAQKSKKDVRDKLLGWGTQAINDLTIDYKFLTLSIITGGPGTGAYSIPIINQIKRYQDIINALAEGEVEEGLEKISKNIPGNQIGKDIYNTVLDETDNVE